jgi:excisionase family DNA binding protein
MSSPRRDADGTFLTARQTADTLNISVEEVYALGRAKRLPALRVGVVWRFPRKFIVDLVTRIEAGDMIEL